MLTNHFIQGRGCISLKKKWCWAVHFFFYYFSTKREAESREWVGKRRALCLWQDSWLSVAAALELDQQPFWII
jgi:hypothetical protein